MPTLGGFTCQITLLDNEVNQEYKDGMLLKGVPYVQYQHFNRL